MPTKREYEEAAKERLAREQGRSIPHYTGKVAKKLASPRKGGTSTTPSKRAAR